MLTPKPLRYPWFIVPLCIISTTLGIQLLLFRLLPDVYPAIHERMIDQRLASAAFMIGATCVALPIILLLWATKQDSREQ